VTLKSVPFWWVSCDHRGCYARCPDLGDEIDPWRDRLSMIESVAASEWRINGFEHWCPDHAQEVTP